MRNASVIQFTLRHLGWIAVSLLLALVVWVAANMANNPIEERELKDIPVSIELPEGYVLTEAPSQTTVDVLVRAPQDDWNLIVNDDIQITADLRSIREAGEHRIELEADMPSELHGKIVAVRPSRLTFVIDQQVEKRVAVQVVVGEEPPLGYTYPSDLTCDETEALVRGTADTVANVARAEARLNLGGDLNPVTKTVTLTPVRDNGTRAREVEVIPATVSCFVDVQVREDVTPVEVMPNRGGTNPPSGYSFVGYTDIQPERVGVTGDPDAITGMNRVVGTMPIDLTNRTETFTTEIPLALPTGVSLVTENQLIRVTVIIAPVLDNREFQDVPVEITGLDSTLYHASGAASPVTVNVAGPQIQLRELGVENLRIVADLTGLPAGNHQVKLVGSIIGTADNSAISISSIVPEQLGITIGALNPTPLPSPTPTGEAGGPVPSFTPTETQIPVDRSDGLFVPVPAPAFSSTSN